MSNEIKLARFDVPDGFDYLVERCVNGDYYRASEVDATVAELRAELERVSGELRRTQDEQRGTAYELASRAIDSGGGWQPIETAPRDGTKVLVCKVNEAGEYDFVYTAWFKGRHWRLMETTSGAYRALETEPTHWREIPPAPSEREEGV